LLKWKGGALIFCFENVSVDGDRRELRRGSELVSVEPQVFDILLHLVTHRARVVSKDELVAAVWGGRVVSDSAITSRITAVRQAIGDSGGEQRLIRTIPRKGFRFAADVTKGPAVPELMPPNAGMPTPSQSQGLDPPGAAVAEESAEAVGSSRPGEAIVHAPFAVPRLLRVGRNIRTSSVFALGGLALAGLCVLAWAGIGAIHKDGEPYRTVDAAANSWRSPRLAATTSLDSLAASALVPLVVLPFANRSDVPVEGRPIADTITEDVTNALSRFPQLRVIAHRSASVYGQAPVDVAAVGAELGVRYAVEGSVQDVGARLRVTVRLIETSTRLYQWAEHFDRDPAELRDSQGIAIGLARALQVGVFAAQTRRMEVMPPATDILIAKGYAVQHKGYTLANLTHALELFEKALASAPNLPPALVAVAAGSIDLVANFFVAEHKRYLNRSEALLQKALELAPDSAEAHYYVGRLRKMQGRFDAAQQHFLRALQLNPSFSPAYGQLGHTLVRQRRAREGLEHIRYALRLSPKDPGIGFWYLFAGEAHLELGEDEEAMTWISRAATVLPDQNPLLHAWSAAVYALAGKAEISAKHAADFREFTPVARVRGLLRRLSREPETGRRRLDQGLASALTGSQ
jgi:DNA-binding winged helix-turn-helix (wHTH) protein/TolB-like protein